MVGVAEWLRHLVVAQETVGSNPTAHPRQDDHPPMIVFFYSPTIERGYQ
jgi:hypothetical protein